VGHDGAIVATTDGGATWKTQSSGSSANLYAVAFSDAAHGCTVGVNVDTGEGVILTTDNGGAPR
jgi:photosystem II stability/assembly factor-like uncharacterized protein